MLRINGKKIGDVVEVTFVKSFFGVRRRLVLLEAHYRAQPGHCCRVRILGEKHPNVLLVAVEPIGCKGFNVLSEKDIRLHSFLPALRLFIVFSKQGLNLVAEPGNFFYTRLMKGLIAELMFEAPAFHPFLSGRRHSFSTIYNTSTNTNRQVLSRTAHGKESFFISNANTISKTTLRQRLSQGEKHGVFLPSDIL